METRRERREFGEPETTLDDAIYGLVSIFKALETGDNDRFHLETLHHSEEDIKPILRRAERSTTAFSMRWMMKAKIMINNLVLPFTNVIHSFYARQAFSKTKAAHQARAKSGMYLALWVCEKPQRPPPSGSRPARRRGGARDIPAVRRWCGLCLDDQDFTVKGNPQSPIVF